MTAFLGKRYQQIKLLDRLSLGTDSDLMVIGLFNNTTTRPQIELLLGLEHGI
jgi:hypothetical protein